MVIDLALLGLLDEGDLHGYEIRRRVRAQIGLIANISYGSLYPALAKLEKAGDVGVIEGPEDAADLLPSTGSLTGERAASRTRRFTGAKSRRSKKVYRITEQGRTHFATLLAAPGGAEDAKAFGLRWSFARHLDAQARLNLLERRRAQLLNQMDEVEPAPELDRYARSVVDHAADGVARDIHWLDELIAAERDALSNKADTAAGTSAARRASA